MRVIPPLTAARISDQTPFLIDPSMLTSSTAAEPGVGEGAWASGTSYNVGDRVVVGVPSATVTITIASPGLVSWSGHGLPDRAAVYLTTTGALPTGLSAGVAYYVVNSSANAFQLSAEPDGAPIVTTGSQSGTHTATGHVHRLYENQTASNVGKPPAVNQNDWLDVGPTNRWAMFDLLRNTQTIADSPLTVVITPGQRIDAIGAVGLVADSVTVTVTVGGSPVYTYTRDLAERGTTTWYEYFTGRFRQVGEIARFDLPPITNAVITVTLTRATGQVRCGALVLGQQAYIGRALYNAQAGSQNFTEVNRNDFGDASVIRRRSIPTTRQSVRCSTGQLRQIAQLKDDLNAVPAFWAAVEDEDNGYFATFLILGFYTDWSLQADQPEEALQDLSLEEI